MQGATCFTLLALATLLSAVSGHFTLDYPQTRGFDEDIEEDNFCGGFHNVSAERAPWYYKNGPVQIDSHHDTAILNIYVSFEVPTSSASFLHTSSGVALPTLRNDLALKGQGEFCFHANASNISVAGVDIRDGTNATIMVEFISNTHGHLYQCSDVTFSSNSSIGSDISCTDALTAASTSSGSSDSTQSTTSSMPTSSSGSTTQNASDRVGVPAIFVLLSVTLISATVMVL